jgi:hypothetical protein
VAINLRVVVVVVIIIVVVLERFLRVGLSLSRYKSHPNVR